MSATGPSATTWGERKKKAVDPRDPRKNKCDQMAPVFFLSGHKEKSGAMSSMLQICQRIWKLQEEIRDLERLIIIHDAIPESLHGPVWWVESRRVLVDERRELDDRLREILQREWPKAPTDVLHAQS